MKALRDPKIALSDHLKPLLDNMLALSDPIKALFEAQHMAVRNSTTGLGGQHLRETGSLAVRACASIFRAVAISINVRE
jgi:hypothetical protein